MEVERENERRKQLPNFMPRLTNQEDTQERVSTARLSGLGENCSFGDFGKDFHIVL